MAIYTLALIVLERVPADGHRGLRPALEHGVFATVLVTSVQISLAFLFALLSLRLIRHSGKTSVPLCYVVVR